jgi:hypothetical protein
VSDRQKKALIVAVLLLRFRDTATAPMMAHAHVDGAIWA